MPHDASTAEVTPEEIRDLIGRAAFLPCYGKQPLAPGWREATPESCLSYDFRGWNLGVALGSNSDGLIAIDIDDDEVLAQLLDATPLLQTSLRVRGKRGEKILVRIIGELPRNQKLWREGRIVGELQTDGAQCIVWGVHPDTQRRYAHPNLATPVTLRWDEVVLPTGVTTTDTRLAGHQKSRAKIGVARYETEKRLGGSEAEKRALCSCVQSARAHGRSDQEIIALYGNLGATFEWLAKLKANPAYDIEHFVTHQWPAGDQEVSPLELGPVNAHRAKRQRTYNVAAHRWWSYQYYRDQGLSQPATLVACLHAAEMGEHRELLREHHRLTTPEALEDFMQKDIAAHDAQFVSGARETKTVSSVNVAAVREAITTSGLRSFSARELAAHTTVRLSQVIRALHEIQEVRLQGTGRAARWVVTAEAPAATPEVTRDEAKEAALLRHLEHLPHDLTDASLLDDPERCTAHPQYRHVPALLAGGKLVRHGDSLVVAARARETRELLTQIRRHHWTIITGGPGTGKTHEADQLLRAKRGKNPRVRLLVTTRANELAKRLTKRLGVEVQTMHRGFGIPVDADQFEAPSRGTRYDTVVIDEASMLTPVMLTQICQTLARGTHVMLVGDVDQIPGDRGAVLRDLIAAGESGQHQNIVVKRLTKAWRFDAASRGLLGAIEATRAGDLSALLAAARIDESFRIQIVGTTADIARETADAAIRRGCNALACLTSDEYGAGAIARRMHGRAIAVGDTVVCTVTDHRRNVTSGMRLTVTDIGVKTVTRDEQPVDLTVYAFSEVATPLTQEEVCLPECLTIARVQGGEEDELVVGLQNYRALTREVLYTAVTRCKKRCTLVTTREALERALATSTVRNTYLSKLLLAA